MRENHFIHSILYIEFEHKAQEVMTTLAPPVKIMQFCQHQSPNKCNAMSIQTISMQFPPKKKKRVSFKPTVVIQPIEPLARSQEDKSRLYHSKEEMKAFATEAKSVHILSSSDPNGACTLGLEAYPSLRGLELYLFLGTRVRNQGIAKQAFLRYQHNLNTKTNKAEEEKIMCLSVASQKLSNWSRLVALETARIDSLRVYDGEDYLIPIETDSVDIEPFPAFPPPKRRRVTTEDEQDVDTQTSKRSKNMN